MSSLQRKYYRIADGTHDRIECAANEADLISSLCEDGMHAPVFDLDMRATLGHAPHGSRSLEIDVKGDALKISAFLQLLCRFQVIDEGVLGQVQSQWNDYEEHTFPFPTIFLQSPAALLPSHTEGHFHLLIDHTLDWASYEHLLIRAENAGVIAMEYLVGCRTYQKGFLWMPGKKRDWLRRLERRRFKPEAAVHTILKEWPDIDPYCGFGGCGSDPVDPDPFRIYD